MYFKPQLRICIVVLSIIILSVFSPALALAQDSISLGITPPLATQVTQFHRRPFLVIQADRFVDAIRAQIKSEAVLALPEYLGGFDQFIDSTDAANDLTRIKALWKLH